LRGALPLAIESHRGGVEEAWLDPVERAIRSAFEKGDAEDRAFRERVYRKAFEALDRALKANPSLTVETAIKRRKSLQSRIAEIESEYIPAVGPAVAPPVEADGSDPLAGPVALDLGAGLTHDERVASPAEMDAATLGALGGLNVAADRAPPGADAGAGLQADPAGRPPRRRRPYAWAFLAATVLAVVAVGAVFAYQTGLFLSAEQRDTAVPNPSPIAEGEDFIPEAEAPAVLPGNADPDRDWISIFDPAKADGIVTPGGATAELLEDESGRYVRVRSGPDGASVSFEIGQGVLERLAGRTATFDIVARAEEGQETEMSVDCSFGELGDCGRRRYAVGYEKADYLFELALPDVRPGAGGAVAVVSDFAQQGRAVDIYEIRVSINP
jgi:hypothetical protein